MYNSLSQKNRDLMPTVPKISLNKKDFNAKFSKNRLQIHFFISSWSLPYLLLISLSDVGNIAILDLWAGKDIHSCLKEVFLEMSFKDGK